MRLIDGDALLEIVEDHTTTVSFCLTVDEAKGKSRMKQLIVEDIRNMPTVNSWISVKDRLPDEGKYVLVWESQGFAYCDKLICGIWNIGASNGAIITHWMPLPEPPKEVKRDD